jgi:hypothetical protein
MPISSLPPPAAAYIDENQFIMHVGPLTANRSDCSRSYCWFTGDDRLFWGEEKCVRLSVGSDSVSDNEARIVDALCHIENLKTAIGDVADGVEINHLPIAEKKCVRRTVSHGGKANYLTRSVAAKRATLSAS